MHEKMELKTNTLAVAVTAGWPMALTFLVLGGMVMLLWPLSEGWPMLLILAVVLTLTFLWCLKMYLGTYIFLPPTEYKGARIIARLGRNEDIEISGVLASEIIIKQGWLEKKLGVCHIRQKGTTIYLRGVQEMDKVQAWVNGNFPQERKAAARKGKKKK